MRRFPWPSWYEPPAWSGKKTRRVNGRNLVREACEIAGLSLSEFMGPCKVSVNTETRQALVYVLHRRRPDLSWPQIARMVGRKDHSTVLHAHEAAKRKLSKSPEFASLVAELEMFQ